MLKDINDIYGTQLVATDAKIGQVNDFYFDEKNWIVRYLVADSGSLVPGRQVLLSPHAFNGFGKNGDALPVNLTKVQIENGPSIESHDQVTRQQERDYYHYYGWPAYWEGGTWDLGAYQVLSRPAAADNPPDGIDDPLEDNHLRRTRSVNKFDIEGRDGLLGSISGFLVDHKSWAIADLVVDSGPWYSGRRILISPTSVKRICDTKSEIAVNHTRAGIQRTLEDEVAKPVYASAELPSLLTL